MGGKRIMREERIECVPLKSASIKDPFWSKYIGRVKEEVLPYQWEMMNDRIEGAEKSGCIHNFQIAAGEKTGEFEGMPFQDSDLSKWLEAAAFSLASWPDEELEKLIDQTAGLIEKAQQEDGYFDTCFILNEPDKKWLNLLEGHELYVSGHFIEAAVAYFRVTGKRNLLDIACRNADLICTVFGAGEGQCKGYPGHQEIELALVKLYEVTEEKKYLDMAGFFIDERGKEPYILESLHKIYGHDIFPDICGMDRSYCQTHQPVREQDTAQGHAVRAVYMYAAMADLAFYEQDASLFAACEKLYRNIVQKRMYLTGSIGSASYGERFTCDYDLPNDTNYSESCASIGLAMFCRRMLAVTGDAQYADTMETALYNTVTAGISLDGKSFFYVNPLEVWPESCEANPSKAHVKTTRQKWFACACCPPNIARTLASLQDYAYGQSGKTAYIHLYAAGKVSFDLDGVSAGLRIEGRYPFEDQIAITVEKDGDFTLALRKPGWCSHMTLRLNGEPAGEGADFHAEKGYFYLERSWKKGDRLTVAFSMPPRLVCANPKVRADAGKAAIMKGPLVYCLESCDNGENLSALRLNPAAPILENYVEKLFGGTTVLTLSGKRVTDAKWDERLYQDWKEETEDTTITAIPYCCWNNRGKGEMQVWTQTDARHPVTGKTN